jgi:hypothetical protein
MASRHDAAALWTCPKCGAKFVNRNNWHSCGRATLSEWKRKMTPRARAIFDRFESIIASFGEYHVAPAATRIAFLGHVRFGGVRRVSGDTVVFAFALPGPVASSRFSRVKEEVPGWWAHELVVTDPAQLDAQVTRWLRRSYELFGMRGRLKAGRATARTRRLSH